MIRKVLFWLHLSAGITAGVFIFIMAATGVLLSFERQTVELVDRDMSSVAVPNDAQPIPVNELLATVRRAGLGDPTSVVVRKEPQTATQFLIGRGKTIYVDPYCGAVLGASSARAHAFFSAVERLHRSLGAPAGSKNIGHWAAAIANLLFGALIVLGVLLWLPRKWSYKAIRASIAFRTGLRGRAREWNWHNVLGIWLAVPLLVMVLSGVVMSFDWANDLLFRMTGSVRVSYGNDGGKRHSAGQKFDSGEEPDYEHLIALAKRFNPAWRTITVNLVADATSPVSAVIDTGTGGEPQDRTQYVINRETGNILKATAFESGSPGQRLRAFVRFGHTGEYYGLLGQAIAGLASLGACVLVYTGISLALRRLRAALSRRERFMAPGENLDQELPLVGL